MFKLRRRLTAACATQFIILKHVKPAAVVKVPAHHETKLDVPCKLMMLHYAAAKRNRQVKSLFPLGNESRK